MPHPFSRRALIGAGLALAVLGATPVKSEPTTIQSDVDATTLHASKATPLGLYLTPVAAHKALTENPEILFIDVRDPIELTYVGHAEGLDRIIPVGLATREVNPKTDQYRMVGNEDFVAHVDAFVAEQGKTKSDPILLSLPVRPAFGHRGTKADRERLYECLEPCRRLRGRQGARWHAQPQRLAQRGAALELQACPGGHLGGLESRCQPE